MPFDMNKSRQYWKIQRYNQQIDWIAEHGITLSGYMEYYGRFSHLKRMTGVEWVNHMANVWRSDLEALEQYYKELPCLR